MTIPVSGDKIASVADDGRTSKTLTDRRRGGGTTGRQGDDLPAAEESRKMMKKILTRAGRCDNLYRLSLEADRKVSR